MKMFGVGTRRMAEGFYVAGQKKIKRLDLLRILLPLIQFCERVHYNWTAYGDPTDCRQGLKGRFFGREPQRLPHHRKPDVRDPLTIFALGIRRVEEMTQAMLGPSVFPIIYSNRFVTICTEGHLGFVFVAAKRATASQQFRLATSVQ